MTTTDDARFERFLEALAEHRGNVRAACAASGLTKSAAYRRRASDPGFKARWDKAAAGDRDIEDIRATARTLMKDPSVPPAERIDAMRELRISHRGFGEGKLPPSKMIDDAKQGIEPPNAAIEAQLRDIDRDAMAAAILSAAVMSTGRGLLKILADGLVEFAREPAEEQRLILAYAEQRQAEPGAVPLPAIIEAMRAIHGGTPVETVLGQVLATSAQSVPAIVPTGEDQDQQPNEPRDVFGDAE